MGFKCFDKDTIHAQALEFVTEQCLEEGTKWVQDKYRVEADIEPQYSCNEKCTVLSVPSIVSVTGYKPPEEPFERHPI